MNSKERMLTTLNHQEPDRVPVFYRFTPEYAALLYKYYIIANKNKNNVFGSINPELNIKIGNDILTTSQGFINSYYMDMENDYVDEWGVGWKVVKYNTIYGEGRYTEISKHPLQEDNSIKKYIPPDPTENKRYITSEEII